MTESQKTRWPFSLLRTSENKEGNRLAVSRPASHELVGVDGQLVGGLRPFPGFIEIHEFKDVYSIAGYNGTTRPEILEFEVFGFLIGSDKYGVGVVYRIRRSSSSGSADYYKSDLFFDWWSSGTKKWDTANLLAEEYPLPPADAVPKSAGKQMSVSVTGQLIYVFVEDSQPLLIRVDDSGVSESLEVVTDTGPNRKPTILSTDESEGLGAIRTTGAADRDGHGQVVLLEYYPSEVNLGLTQPDSEVRSLLPGNYSFAYRLRSSTTGRISGISEICQARSANFDPLAYLGSSSGAGSGYASGSGIAGTGTGVPLFAAMEICYNPDKYDQAYIYRSVRVESAGGTFTSKIYFLEKIIDLADYHSVNNPLADELGAKRRQAIYFYELEDKMLVQKPTYGDRELFDEEMPYGGSSKFYEGTLLVSKLRTATAPSSDENTVVDTYLGVGELRWSSLYETSPELFPVYNRYVPSPPSDDILTFQFAGPHVIGFSKNRQYIIRREGGDIQVEPMHDGYGVAGYRGADTVGSLIYLVTTKGIKTVDAYGQLEAVNSLNQVIVEDWASVVDELSVAYDSLANVLYVLNPDAEKAAVLWFNTAMVTEIHDVPFKMVNRGPWPDPFVFDRGLFEGVQKGSGNDDYDNPLRETAIFLQNHVSTSPTQASLYPRLLIADYQRTRTQSAGSHNGEAENTLLPLGGDAVMTVTSYSEASGLLFVSTAGSKTRPTYPDGSYLYVLKSADPDLVGTKAQMTGTLSSTGIYINPSHKSRLSNISSGDIVGFSPVFFQWVGFPLGLQSEGGQLFSSPEDFFVTRHVEALGCYFSDVSGSALTETTGLASFKALLYSGAVDDPVEVVEVYDDGQPVTSISEHESIYYAAYGKDSAGILTGRYGVSKTAPTPGVRIYCPNLDYWLVAVLVEGQVRPASRTQRS